MKKCIGIVVTSLLLIISIISFSAASTQVISIGTAPAGGAWYAIGGALADVITKNVDGLIANAEVTGAAVENVKLLGLKEIQLGFTINAIAEAGYKGKPPFPSAYKNLRTLISNIQMGYLQIVSLDASEINFVSDLRGKRIAVGPSGHGSLIRLKEIFETIGFNFNDITPVYLPYDQSLNALGDKKVDAAVLYVAPPASAIAEFSLTHNIKLISLNEENRKRILEKYPYYTAVEIPSGSYKNVNYATPTVATSNLVLVDETLDEEIVYKITKSIFENIDKIRSSHPSAKDFSLDVATKGSTVPFHPGAIKYFKEQGVWENN